MDLGGVVSTSLLSVAPYSLLVNCKITFYMHFKCGSSPEALQPLRLVHPTRSIWLHVLFFFVCVFLNLCKKKKCLAMTGEM